MSNDADLERLRREFYAMFDRIVEVVRAREQAAVSGVLRDAMAKLAGVSTPQELPAAQTFKPDQEHPPAETQRAHQIKRGERAPVGFVQSAVERILNASTVPLSPGKIVDLGGRQGLPLKESSVRMALMSLRDKGRAEQMTRSDWRMKVRQSAESLFTETSRAADPAQDIRDATQQAKETIVP